MGREIWLNVNPPVMHVFHVFARLGDLEGGMDEYLGTGHSLDEAHQTFEIFLRDYIDDDGDPDDVWCEIVRVDRNTDWLDVIEVLHAHHVEYTATGEVERVKWEDAKHPDPSDPKYSYAISRSRR